MAKDIKRVFLELIIGEIKQCGVRIHSVDTKLVSKFMAIEK